MTNRIRLGLDSLETRTVPATLPPGFNVSVVATTMTSPTALVEAPDGRLFVAEQRGVLRIIDGTGLLPTPAIDLSSRINDQGERGLLGLELDPNFTANGYIYLYYTRADPLNNRVSRFRVTGNTIDPNSELVLVDLDPLFATNHNGGAIHFGGDGKLYVAIGENANPPLSQSLTTRHGKILRINSDGTIPADNPTAFAGITGTTTGVNRAIFAVGFRNPFTFAVQPGTGQIRVNDVGQTAFEEIDDLTAGANYGWPATEGDFDPVAFPNFTRPIHSYEHGSGTDKGFAIAGGAFYNPPTTSFPNQYVGDYFFADVVNRWINVYDATTKTVANFASDLDTSGIVDVDVIASGDILFVARGSGSPGIGTVYRIRSTTAPGIATDPSDTTIRPGQTATFRVNANGGQPLTYQWQRNRVDIPGETQSTLTLANRQLTDSGTTYRVVVRNGTGSATSAEATLVVTTDLPPTPTILTPAVGTQFVAGQSYSFSGSATDAEDGALPASGLSWRVDYFTGSAPARPFVPETKGITSGTFTIPTITPYTAADVFYRVNLTATDSFGNKTIATRDILPTTATVRVLASAVSALTLDGQPIVAPHEFVGVAGIERQLVAANTIASNGLPLTFQGWSDGITTPSRTFITPTVPTTIRANYTAPRTFAVGSQSTVQIVDAATTKAYRSYDLAAESRVATADVTGDGIADTIVGTGPGSATSATIFDGGTGAVVRTIPAFEPTFTGGIFVAAGDIDGDGIADIALSADEGGGPRVTVYRGNSDAVLADFFAIDDVDFRGGARVAIGNLNGDSRADLVVSAGFGGGPRVAGYDGASLATGKSVKLFGDFFAYESSLRNGAYVAVGDVDGDGRGDLIFGAGPGGGPRVRALNGADLLSSNTQTTLANFFAGDIAARGGIRVATTDADGDRFADIVVGTAPGTPSRVIVYRGASASGGTLDEIQNALATDESNLGGVYVG